MTNNPPKPIETTMSVLPIGFVQEQPEKLRNEVQAQISDAVKIDALSINAEAANNPNETARFSPRTMIEV